MQSPYNSVLLAVGVLQPRAVEYIKKKICPPKLGQASGHPTQNVMIANVWGGRSEAKPSRKFLSQAGNPEILKGPVEPC